MWNALVKPLTTHDRARIKTVAIPNEHGSWAFLLEPVLLGLLVAPSLPGVFLAIAGVDMFLTRHPLRLVWSDWRRGVRAPRTGLAEQFVLLYGGVMLAGLLGVFLTASPLVLLPALIAVPPTLALMLRYDAAGQRRALLVELAGPVALGALAPGIALAGGWELLPALGLWAVIVARAIPSILYIRARLRLERGQAAASIPTIGAHLAALVAAALLAWGGVVPALAAAAMALLLWRAVHGLSARREVHIRAQKLGLLEMGYGLATILAVAAGYAFNL